MLEALKKMKLEAQPQNVVVHKITAIFMWACIMVQKSNAKMENNVAVSDRQKDVIEPNAVIERNFRGSNSV